MSPKTDSYLTDPSGSGLWVADCVEYKQGVLKGQQFQGSVMSMTHKLKRLYRQRGKQSTSDCGLEGRTWALGGKR